MKFPPWVSVEDGRRLSGRELASNRLYYLLSCAALQVDRRAHLSALAEHCGTSRQNLHFQIMRGRCSQRVAEAVERLAGREVVRKEHLTDPLEIVATQ